MAKPFLILDEQLYSWNLVHQGSCWPTLCRLGPSYKWIVAVVTFPFVPLQQNAITSQFIQGVPRLPFSNQFLPFLLPRRTPFVFRPTTHSFIHSDHFYSASSSPLQLRGDPDTARMLCRGFTQKRQRQLWVKNIPGPYVCCGIRSVWAISWPIPAPYICCGIRSIWANSSHILDRRLAVGVTSGVTRCLH